MPDIDAIEEFLADTLEAVQRAEAELIELERRKKEVMLQLDDLRAEEDGLRLLLKRHAPDVREHPRLEIVDESGDRAAAATRPELTDMRRTDAIVAVLRDRPRGLSPADIRDALREHGRDDEYKVVSAALSHLKNQGRVTSPRRGLYLATAKEVATT